MPLRHGGMHARTACGSRVSTEYPPHSLTGCRAFPECTGGERRNGPESGLTRTVRAESGAVTLRNAPETGVVGP